MLTLPLAGCVLMADAEQDSLCRRIIPALVESRQVLVEASAPLGTSGVTVSFTAEDQSGPHLIACVFAGSGLDVRKRHLLHVILDGQAVSSSALHFLREGWLQTQDAIAAEPAAARPQAWFHLQPATAYLLQQGLAALPRMGIYALIAAAYALVYGLIGRINLAFGAFVALGGIGAAMAVFVVQALGVSSITIGLTLAALTATGLGALSGGATGRLVFAPLMRRPGQHMLVASAGLLLALEEFLRLAQGANTLWLAPVYNVPMLIADAPGFDVTITPIALITAYAALLAALTLRIVMERSRFGLHWRAASDDPGVAGLFGVNARRLLTLTVAAASGLAGFAGFLVTVLYGGIGFAGGAMMGMTALTAAVLGGIGSVEGAMIGGCLIALFEALWSTLLPIAGKDLALFAVLAAFLVFRPNGLFDRPAPGPMRV